MNPNAPGRIVAWLLIGLALAGMAAPAAAQTVEVPPPATVSAPAPGIAAEDIRRLADLLEDPAARQALVARLIELADGSAPQAGTAGDRLAAVDRSIAHQVASTTRGAAQDVTVIADHFLEAFERVARLFTADAARERAVLVGALVALGIVIVATIPVFLLLRLLARYAYARLVRAAEDRGIVLRGSLLLVSVLIDAAAVGIAWLAGHAVALFLVGDSGVMDVRQSLYLNAFLFVELSKTLLQALLSPRARELRLFPLPDLAARHWYRSTARIVAVLGYGLLLVVPIVKVEVSLILGASLAIVIGSVGAAMAIAVIMRNRRQVRRALGPYRRSQADGFVGLLLQVIGRIWHIVAIGYVLALLVVWVLRPDDALPFVLAATGESVLAILVGALITIATSRFLQRGIHVRGKVAERLPLLETRLRSFVPVLLRIVRFVALVAVLIYVAATWTLIDLHMFVPVIDEVLGATIVIVLAFAAWLVIESWIDYRLNSNVGTVPTPRERTLLSLFRNAAALTILVIAFMFTLDELGVNIGPLLAGAGVVGLAVGFGAQKLVQDIITGAFIQLENAFNEGDVVTVAGISGVVEKLTIRSVSLRDLHGVFHIIPFSSVDSVSNFMRGFSYWVADIGIAYRESIDQAKALMFEAFDDLASDPDIGRTLIGPLDWFGVDQLGDSAVVLRARLKTTPGAQWAAGRRYNELVKRRFDEAGVEVPFPQLTLWFGEAKTGNAPAGQLVVQQLRATGAA